MPKHRYHWPLAIVAASTVLVWADAAAAHSSSRGGGMHAALHGATHAPPAAGGPAMHRPPQSGKPSSTAPASTPAAASAAAAAAIALGPPAPAQMSSTTLPPSEIGAPMPQLPPLAPLSPPVTTTILPGGGTPAVRPDALPSPSSASSSPSESAPSIAGGGGSTLADCMKFWEPATHMSKMEWRAACKRSMAEFPDIAW